MPFPAAQMLINNLPTRQIFVSRIQNPASHKLTINQLTNHELTNHHVFGEVFRSWLWAFLTHKIPQKQQKSRPKMQKYHKNLS